MNSIVWSPSFLILVILPTSHWDSSHLQWHLPGAYFSDGRAPSGVVSNRVGRVSPIIDTAAARKIDVRFFFFLIDHYSHL